MHRLLDPKVSVLIVLATFGPSTTGCDASSEPGDLTNRVLTACAIHMLCTDGSFADHDVGQCELNHDFIVAQGGNLDAAISCYAAAESCDEAAACAVCVEGTTECAGNAIRYCWMGAWENRPCDGGGTCFIDGEGEPACAYGACSGSEPYCEGAVGFMCDGSVQDRLECNSPFHRSPTCVAEEYGVRCVSAPVRPCEYETFQGYCDGNVAVTCNGRYVLEWDCDQFPTLSECLAIPEYHEAICARTGDGEPCDDEEDATCVGSVLRACVNSRWLTFDCARVGGACNAEAGVCFRR
jgi:hypothetical protein